MVRARLGLAVGAVLVVVLLAGVSAWSAPFRSATPIAVDPTADQPGSAAPIQVPSTPASVTCADGVPMVNTSLDVLTAAATAEAALPSFATIPDADTVVLSRDADGVLFGDLRDDGTLRVLMYVERRTDGWAISHVTSCSGAENPFGRPRGQVR